MSKIWVSLIIFIVFIIAFVCTFGELEHSKEMNKTNHKKTKCLNPPETAKKVEKYIKECQEEVKFNLLTEALGIIHEKWESEGDAEYGYRNIEHDRLIHHSDFEHHGHYRSQDHEATERKHRIQKRTAGYHPILVPHEDKRIAGCLLHCVYAKNNAIDKVGWPTLDGLVDFYAEGVNEHGYFMATLRSVDKCLKAAAHKYRVNRLHPPSGGKSCDLAFDVFDCISDQITDYCFNRYKN